MPSKRDASHWQPAGPAQNAGSDFASDVEGEEIDSVNNQLLESDNPHDDDDDDDYLDAQEAEEVADTLVTGPWLGWDPEDLLSLAHGKFVWEIQIDQEDPDPDANRVDRQPSTSRKKGKAGQTKLLRPKSVVLTFDAYDLMRALQGSSADSHTLQPDTPNRQQIPVPFKAKVKLVQPTEAVDDVPELTASVNVGLESESPVDQEAPHETAKEALGRKVFTDDFKAGLPQDVRKIVQDPVQRTYKAMRFSVITEKDLKELGFHDQPAASEVDETQMSVMVQEGTAEYLQTLRTRLPQAESREREEGLCASLCAVLNLDTSQGGWNKRFFSLFWKSVAGTGFSITLMVLAALQFYGKRSEMRTRTIIDLLAILLTIFCGAAGINCLVFPELVLSAQEPRSSDPDRVILDPKNAVVVVSDTHAMAFTGRPDYHFLANIDARKHQRSASGESAGSTFRNAMRLLRLGQNKPHSQVVVVEVKGLQAALESMLPQVCGQSLASMYLLRREFQPYILTNGEEWLFGCIQGSPRRVVKRTNRFFKISLRIPPSANENKQRWENPIIRGEIETLFSLVVFWSTQDGKALYKKIGEWSTA